MNSVAESSALRNALLNSDWAVIIQGEIDAMPDSLCDFAEPALVGRLDAEMGEPCQPLEYYARLGDIEQYVIGWKETMAELAETVEYEEDMLDREYHARGQW